MKKAGLSSILIAVAVLAVAVIAEAQQAKKIPRIGLLGLASGPAAPEESFLQGLRDLGYVEGQNITIEYRWAGGKVDRLPTLAEELVRLKVDLIAVRSAALHQHSRTGEKDRGTRGEEPPSVRFGRYPICRGRGIDVLWPGSETIIPPGGKLCG